MKIGLIDVDGAHFPNLAQMKISAYHKQRGDDVEWWNGFLQYDKVYMSKVFTFTDDMEQVIYADEIVKGGTGYDLGSKLPEEIEHIYPDYGLYGITDTAYGFLTRGCPRGCEFCVVAGKEGRKSVYVADLDEFWRGQKFIELLDPNTLACKDHERLLKQLVKSKAYVNFNQGVDCRLLTKENISLLNKVKIKQIHFAWDRMQETDRVLKGLKLYAQHATRKPHGTLAMVYVLTNFETTHEEDRYRVARIAEMGYDPYVMIYDKPNAPKLTKHLQRWCNNKFIFKSCTFEEYLATRKD